MSKFSKKWTKRDLELLRAMWPNKTGRAIAQELGFSADAVSNRGAILGLPRKGHGRPRSARRPLHGAERVEPENERIQYTGSGALPAGHPISCRAIGLEPFWAGFVS